MPPKRKRNDRASVDGSRPSPHRPGDTSLGHHERDDKGRGRAPRGTQGRRDSSNSNSGRTSSNQPPQSPRQGNLNSMQPPPAAAVQPAAPQGEAQRQQVAPASPPNLNYHYDNLTADRLDNWATRGQQEVMQHGIQSKEDFDITELSSLFQEFIHAVVEGKLDAASAGACVQEILGNGTYEMAKGSYTVAPNALFLDSLAIVVDNNPELYQPSLRDFLKATGISTESMRLILDPPILQQLGLIRDNFQKVGVRQATNLLYRQANYNLLREESEGYSKLINELYPHSYSDAEQTFERIKALIGTFDLDVGRVLDIVLDVTATMLMKQYRFFVKFLRASSWWPRSRLDSAFSPGLPQWALPGFEASSVTEADKEASAEQKRELDAVLWRRARELHLPAFFELAGRRLTGAEIESLEVADGHATGDASSDFEREWMSETKTLAPPGNRVAAHLLGFKLLYYYSDLRDADEVLPANLLWLAALLIKIGFISIVDLYPHLSPPDEEMEEVRRRQMARIEDEERALRGGPMNALLMAGELPQGDDDNPAASNTRRDADKKADIEKKVSEPEATKNENAPHEQKATLLTQLLTIGALPESLFILGRFPWMTEAFPEVLVRIHRILHVMVDKVYNSTKPVSTRPLERVTKQMAAVDQSGMPKGSVRQKRLPLKTPMRWPHPDVIDNEENQRYHFYWEEWTDNIPVCQGVDDIFTLCNTFLNLSGVNIGKDEALLSKLAAIGRFSLSQDTSKDNLARWHDLLKRLLVPALSHTSANASVIEQIWTLLRYYPTTTRYTIYAEWFEGQTSRLPAMKTAFARATSETKGIMKRVSQTNLGEMARKLAKSSYASPGIVFKVALSQLQSYKNLIEMFVECAKYFTDLSYDVLVWSLLNALGASRSRTQQEHALSVSMWLQALSRFSGRIFRRYQNLDPVPVLQYVNNQLLQRNPTDLIILTEFVYSMGGIEESLNFTENQVLSLAGGAYLRKQTLIRAQDKRFENVRSSRRLVQALETSKLGVQLLINLAQYAQGAIFHTPDDAHVKFLANIAEESHAALIRYLDFLWSNLEPAAFDALVPSIPELMTTYGLDAGFAFLIGRSSLAVRMFPWKAKKSLGEKDVPEVPKSAAAKEDDVAMTDAKPNEEPSNVEEQKPEDTMLKALQPVVGALEQSMPSGFWQKMKPEFYTAFWALQLGDLYCPDKMYRQERERLKADELAVAKDRTDMSRRAQERKMEKRKELMQLQIGLSEECGEHLLRQAKWKFQLTKLFQTSFPDSEAKAESVSDVLLERCFLPRALISIADAEYTFKFLKALHEWNAPGFRLMSLYDRLFNANRLRSLIFTCTTREADYLGHFLKLIMEDLARWHKNAPVADDADPKGAKSQPRLGAYEKEGRGTNEQARLGFAKELDDDGKPKTFIEHAEFQDTLFRWHRGINTALKACLSGQEWMHIRNAIAVLRALLDFFPAVDFMAKQFMSQLQKVHNVESAKKTAEDCEEGGRVDLATAAQTAISEMQRRKSKWVMVQAFRANANGVTGADTDKGVTGLRPTAAEFKPGSRRKAPGADEEDGEVQDASESKAGNNIQDASDKKSAAPHQKTPNSSKPTHDSRREQGPAPSGPERASTPKAAASSTPSNGRPDPRANTLPERPPQGLPTRPDVPIPPHPSDRFGTGRPGDRRDARDPREHWNNRDTREQRDSRDSRDPRDSRDNRDHRDNRDPRVPEVERTRDHYAGGRGPDLIRDVGRSDLPPRPSPADRDRERSHRESRVGRQNDREVQPVAGQPSTTDSGQEPMMNPERAALFAQDSSDRSQRSADQDRRSRGGRTEAPAAMDTMNPERVALISDLSQNTPTRGPRDSGRERGPRGQSPGRNGRHGNEDPPAGVLTDDRHVRQPPHDPRGLPRDSWDQPQGFAPNRNDRAPGRDIERTPAERMRDATIHQSPDPRNDPAPRGVHQDQNYGRLNPVPTGPEIPSGPRGRGRGSGRGGHNSPQPPASRTDSRFDTHNNHPRPGSPDRVPPTGPSSSRHRVTPLSTVTSSEETMHPDRMRAFGGNVEGPRSDFNQSAAAASSIHPDRLTQVRQPQQSTPVRSAPVPGRNPPPVTPTTGLPGPRQSVDGSGFTPSDTIVPTGPASSNERSRSGRGVRQLAGIQNTLQQASATMPEVSRNNSNGNMRRSQQQPRQTLGNTDAQILAGGSAGTTPTQERPDPTAGLGLAPPEGSAGKEQDRGRRDRDDRPDRSGRPGHRDRSERNNRSPGRERDGKEPREHRDRRSGAYDNSRDDRDRRSGRDVMPPPLAVGAGRDLMAPRLGQDEFSQGGSRSGRGGGGDRREDRPREDRGRKRRSEEGLGNLSNDREKRARR